MKNVTHKQPEDPEDFLLFSKKTMENKKQKPAFCTAKKIDGN